MEKRSVLQTSHTLLLIIMTLIMTRLQMTSSGMTSKAGFNAEKLSSVIELSHGCRKDTIPGLAISVVRGGRTLLSRGYGVVSPHSNERVTADTRFNVASLTKALTAALLVKVMDESGRYNLSTPVREILGRHFRFGDDLRTQHATVEDLLSHKMAVPANNRMRFDSTLTRETIVERVRYLKSHDTFRTTFIYSNLMYGLASRMTEVVGKGRWEELVRRHFFRPLGMRRSTFSTEADLNEPGTAKPFVLYKGSLQPISYDLPKQYGELVGSGALISTASDMAKWMTLHLQEGAWRGGRVMRRESLHELHRPRTATPQSAMPLFRQPGVPVTTTFDVYALGWWTGYYRGYPILGHSGASYGYRAFIILVPSLKVGVFVAMNGDDRHFAYRVPLVNLALDHVLGVSPWVDTTTLCTFPAPWHNVSSGPPPPSYDAARPLAHNLSAYLGVYENPAYGRIEIKLAPRQPAAAGRRGSSIYRREAVPQRSRRGRGDDEARGEFARGFPGEEAERWQGDETRDGNGVNRREAADSERDETRDGYGVYKRAAVDSQGVETRSGFGDVPSEEAVRSRSRGDETRNGSRTYQHKEATESHEKRRWSADTNHNGVNYPRSVFFPRVDREVPADFSLIRSKEYDPPRDRRSINPRSLFRRGDQVPPRLTLVYGFARWDLIPLVPKYAALNSKVSSRADFPEYFYGVGQGVNAFVDSTPFIFHPPSTGSDVIEKISAPAFERRFPPEFTRVVPVKSGVRLMGPSADVFFLLLAVLSIAAFISR